MMSACFPWRVTKREKKAFIDIVIPTTVTSNSAPGLKCIVVEEEIHLNMVGYRKELFYIII